MRAKDQLNNNNKMKKRLQVLLVGGLSLLSFACYYDQEIEFPEAPEIPPEQEISFAAEIEPIFSQNGKDCTVCHNGSIANPDLRVGNAWDALVPEYVIAGNGEGSEFYQKLPGNNHPIDAGFMLSTSEIALIKGWIDRGALND